MRRKDHTAKVCGRFVMSRKNYMTESEAAKARYVVQWYNDLDKKFIVHDIVILRISSIRIILSSASILVFCLFSHDFTQAYCQSKVKLIRKIFIRLKPRDPEIFGISVNELLKLIRSLYGLFDAGDYWGLTIEDHLVKHIGMKMPTGVGASFVRKSNDEVEGIAGFICRWLSERQYYRV